MKDEYSIVRQDAANAKYRAEYAKWLAGLNTAQRAELKRLGVFSADTSNQVYKVDCDPEAVGHRWITMDLAGLDGLPEKLAERFGLSLEKARGLVRWHGEILASEVERHRSFLFQRLIAGFLQTKNPKLAAAGLAFAAELNALNGLGSQAEYARQIGLSRAALSKMTKYWQDELNLKPSAFQKSEQACITYAEKGKSDHWRRRKFAAGGDDGKQKFSTTD
jgi:hypothetical protein